MSDVDKWCDEIAVMSENIDIAQPFAILGGVKRDLAFEAYVRLTVERAPAIAAALKTAEERIEKLHGRIEGEYRACSCKDNIGASMSDVCAAASHHVDCVICEERLAVLRADAALASRPHEGETK